MRANNKSRFRLFFMLVSALVSACAYAGPQCVNQGQVCADATPCKFISGTQVCLAGVSLPVGALALSDTCWRYTTTYECSIGAMVGGCQALVDLGCAQVDATCAAMVNGVCGTWNRSYTCPTPPAGGTPSTTTCSLVDVWINQCAALQAAAQ